MTQQQTFILTISLFNVLAMISLKTIISIEWIDIQIYFFLSIFINKISCPSIKSQLNNYVSYGNLADTCSNVKFHDMSPTHIDFENHLNSIHLGGVNINLIYVVRKGICLIQTVEYILQS